ncbi:MAG: hypothetical protein WBJ75_12505 [Pseudohongiellaceae bacterium]
MAQAEQEKFPALAKLVSEYTLALGPFFDLAEKEIQLHNNTDWDDIAFLIKAARRMNLEFSNKAYNLYGDDETGENSNG